MSYLNANIPPQYAFVHKSYLKQIRGDEGTEPCVIHSITAIPGYAPMVNIQTENGACFWRLPFSAVCHKADSAQISPSESAYWNSFSYYPAVSTFDWLSTQIANIKTRGGNLLEGEYVFTIDWAHPESNILNTTLCETPSEHKCHHVIAAEDGNYYLMPNNRILWKEPSFVVKDELPDWDVNQAYHNVEDARTFQLSTDNDKFFYKENKK